MPDFCLYLFGQKAAEDLWQRLPETLVLTGSLLPRYVLLCTFYSLNIVLTGSLLPSSSLADSWWPLYSPNFAFWASCTQQDLHSLQTPELEQLALQTCQSFQSSPVQSSPVPEPSILPPFEQQQTACTYPWCVQLFHRNHNYTRCEVWGYSALPQRWMQQGHELGRQRKHSLPADAESPHF